MKLPKKYSNYNFFWQGKFDSLEKAKDFCQNFDYRDRLGENAQT